MIGNELIHRRNLFLFIIICIFYIIHITINIFIEGLGSIFPPVFLFIIWGILFIILIQNKVNPTVTMYVMVGCIYIYFYYLLNDSPYLVNYLFMWLALPLCAIYQNFRVVVIAGMASIILTYYSFFYLHEEIFFNVVQEDFVFLVLFGVFTTSFLLIFIEMITKANTKLQEIAFHDPLTGAANRLLLKNKFEMLKEANVNSIAILFMDMNGFKKINDTYGHDVGDLLLERVVSRINGVLRDTDLLCRLGGDEFVILLSNTDNLTQEVIAERIQLTLNEPMLMNDKVINISASFGWSYTTEVSHADLENMIKEADEAMYKAKESGFLASHSRIQNKDW